MADDHLHTHDGRPIQEDGGASYFEKRAWAIQELLQQKRVITADEIRRQIEFMDSRSPALGAKVVARAWVDPEYKRRLFADPKAALAELGIDYGEMNVLEVVENTDTVHNMVVCTLCSCYPRNLLGYPPDWYKSLNYRSRAVSEPREVLREFGLELEPEIEVRVHDSSADIRYLVIPRRPAGTEDWTEEQLAELVTRDSMIGVALAQEPRVPAES